MESAESPRPSLLRRALALLVLVAAVALILKVAIHAIVGLATVVLWGAAALAAVVAIVWALRVL
ncbi:MAG: hypothetical protein QOK31_673 [Solirubrobacteraceae bacterium]|jgi:hypothetical protein|nr:hypothetical protein [Solirubrobacteraceae bacterium]